MMEKNMKKNVYNWITLLYYRNYHNIVNILYFNKIKMKISWDFSGGPVVKILPSYEGAVGSIPGQGTKIPRASWPKKQKHKTEAIL